MLHSPRESDAADALLAAATWVRVGQNNPRTHPASRTQTTDHQRDLLDQEFDKDERPSAERRSELAKELGLSERVVQTWFQNRRNRSKRAQTRQAAQSISLLVDAATTAASSDSSSGRSSPIIKGDVMTESEADSNSAPGSPPPDMSQPAPAPAPSSPTHDDQQKGALLSAVHRAAAYSAAVAYQKAMAAGMAEALSFSTKAHEATAEAAVAMLPAATARAIPPSPEHMLTTTTMQRAAASLPAAATANGACALQWATPSTNGQQYSMVAPPVAPPPPDGTVVRNLAYSAPQLAYESAYATSPALVVDKAPTQKRAYNAYKRTVGGAKRTKIAGRNKSFTWKMLDLPLPPVPP